jgi:ribosomal protein S18 acetylase RimI-like enzyme
VEIRLAGPADAADIARLHADSWRRHYRGAYSRHYLDGDLDAERLAVWTERMSNGGEQFTLIAELDRLAVGFVHVVLDADHAWGALVDNLHVTHPVQRSGVGSLLLDRAARTVIERRPGSGIWLWVLEQNEAAQAFYLSRGGVLCGHELAAPPGGDPRNLDGAPRKIRVAWSDPAASILSERHRRA